MAGPGARLPQKRIAFMGPVHVSQECGASLFRCGCTSRVISGCDAQGGLLITFVTRYDEMPGSAPQHEENHSSFLSSVAKAGARSFLSSA
jgi:hypothetical protein